MTPGSVKPALGDRIDYRLAIGDGVTLRVQSDAGRRWPPGAAVGVRLLRARCWAAGETAS